MSAMTIFSMSIRYLREHLIKTVTSQTSGVEETDLRYVLTVPAIWNDNAKQFMREAAVEAGIDDSRLKLCLEPESASVWCQIISTDAKATLSKSGTQYMVVDLGGGTADISVHEKLIDGSLKELHKASGGPWGGNAVDNNYFDWLTEIFGKTTMDRFKTEQMADYFDLFREFETKKRNISLESEGKITFRVSASLKEIYQEVVGIPLKDNVANMGLSKMVTFIGDKLRIDASIVINFFEIPVNSMIAHVKEVLSEKEMKHVDTIVLVGGFAESELVHEEMRKKIQNKRIIFPDEAGLVVLKGAVRFGHIPDIITARVMPFTYGIKVRVPFDEKKHILSKKKSDNGKDEATDIFQVNVRAGQEIKLGQEYSSSMELASDISKDTSLRVFRSSNKKPKYVTDDDCKLLGQIRISSSEGKNLKDRRITATLVFGDTELLVKVKILETGKEFTKHIDCL
ncbi:heat shock 70 kDa protein 12A-like isoform X2 [Mercenaria mercenaria]|nr:heat shock 70 kDa protein 12A-like isoform X2 [Mercenaria mercenaria]